MNLRVPANPDTDAMVACVLAAASVQDRQAREHVTSETVVSDEDRRRADILANYGLLSGDWGRWHILRMAGYSPARAAAEIRRGRPLGPALWMGR